MNITLPTKTYKQITNLDLSNKNLKTFPKEIFECTNLRKLNLSNNLIRKIPQEITSLKKLKVIDLSHNKIDQLYAPLFSLQKLATLNISFNKIKTLPQQIATSNIKNLLLQNNQISAIKEECISNVEKLNLSNNNLEHFSITKKTNLKYLWISNNPIKEFQFEKTNLPYQKKIYAYAYSYQLKTIDSKEYLCFAKTKEISTLEKKEGQQQINSIKKVFLSYSWDSESHKKWVKNLADKLMAKKDIEVILDQYNVRIGTHLTRFIENGIDDSDKILVVLTTKYKEKSKKNSGGAAFEKSIISATLFNDLESEKILPILREGTIETSFPPSIKPLCYIDMTNDANIENKISELRNTILEIHKDKKTIKNT